MDGDVDISIQRFPSHCGKYPTFEIKESISKESSSFGRNGWK